MSSVGQLASSKEEAGASVTATQRKLLAMPTTNICRPMRLRRWLYVISALKGACGSRHQCGVNDGRHFERAGRDRCCRNVRHLAMALGSRSVSQGETVEPYSQLGVPKLAIGQLYGI